VGGVRVEADGVELPLGRCEWVHAGVSAASGMEERVFETPGAINEGWRNQNRFDPVSASPRSGHLMGKSLASSMIGNATTANLRAGLPGKTCMYTYARYGWLELMEATLIVVMDKDVLAETRWEQVELDWKIAHHHVLKGGATHNGVAEGGAPER